MSVIEFRMYRKMRGDRSFSAAAPKLWKSLLHSIRQCSNLREFKRHLKTNFTVAFEHT